MNDVAKAPPKSKCRIVLVAIERRDDGALALHPPSPSEMKCSSPMTIYQDILDLLDDETIPSLESVTGKEFAIEEVVTNVVRDSLPDPLKPLADDAVRMGKTLLHNVGKRPSVRAPIGRHR